MWAAASVYSRKARGEDATISSPQTVTGRDLSWAAGHERVAVYVERPGLVLAFGAAECVDRLARHHVGEAAVLQYFLPARTGQPASYSTGP